MNNNNETSNENDENVDNTSLAKAKLSSLNENKCKTSLQKDSGSCSSTNNDDTNNGNNNEIIALYANNDIDSANNNDDNGTFIIYNSF